MAHLLGVDSHAQPIALGRIQGLVGMIDYLLDGNLKADMVTLIEGPSGAEPAQPYLARELTLEDM